MVVQKPYKGAAGPGLREEQQGHGTGMRCSTLLVHGQHAETLIMEYQPVNNATAWTELTLERRPGGTNITADVPTLPFPQTPCVTWVNLNPTPAFTQTVKLRVTGFDQFGNGIREVTPTVTISANGSAVAQVQSTNFWLSKVFSQVTKVEYQAGNCVAGENVLCMGVRYPWSADSDVVGPADGYNHVSTSFLNWGIGLPKRIRPYLEDPKGATTRTTKGGDLDILGVELYNITQGYSINVPRHYQDAALFRGGWTTGVSLPNWQGCGHKLGLYSTNALPNGNNELKQMENGVASSASTITNFTAANPTVLTVASVPAELQSAGLVFKAFIDGSTGGVLDGVQDVSFLAANTLAIAIDGSPGGAAGNIEYLLPGQNAVSNFARNDICQLSVFLRSSLSKETTLPPIITGTSQRAPYE